MGTSRLIIPSNELLLYEGKNHYAVLDKETGALVLYQKSEAGGVEMSVYENNVRAETQMLGEMNRLGEYLVLDWQGRKTITLE